MGYSSLSDEEIINRMVQDSDQIFFEELIRRHYSNVLHQCLWRLKDTEAAYDVLQEVWIRVHTKLGQYKGQGTFAAWLSVIVRNRCYDHLQEDKRRGHQEISKQLLGGLEADEAIDIENLSFPTIEFLEELMEQLSGEEKRLLHLKYWRGCLIQDIQQEMHLSESAVKSRLFRVKKKLQKFLSLRGL